MILKGCSGAYIYFIRKEDQQYLEKLLRQQDL